MTNDIIWPSLLTGDYSWNACVPKGSIQFCHRYKFGMEVDLSIYPDYSIVVREGENYAWLRHFPERSSVPTNTFICDGDWIVDLDDKLLVYTDYNFHKTFTQV